MDSESPHGSFEDIRNEADGNRMLSTFRYAVPYWEPLTVGVLSTMTNRAARVFPALMIAAAIDLVFTQSGTGDKILAVIGLVPSEPIPADRVSDRLNLLYYLGGSR